MSPHDLVKNGNTVSPKPGVASVLELLERRVGAAPAQEAIRYLDLDSKSTTVLTNAELLKTVLQLAHTLLNTHNLKPGDAVALHLHNSPEILIFHLACWMTGLITVPLDLKRDDLERKLFKLNLTECKLIVTVQDNETEQDVQALKKQNPKLTWIELAKEKPLANHLSPSQPKKTPILSSLDHTGLILFTSGTTAHPKGVKLTPLNIVLNAEGIIQWLKMEKSDRFYVVLPLHHINSTTFCLATLLAGGTIILSSRYTKSGFWETVAREKCTITSIVPTICFDLLTEHQAFLKHKKYIKLNRIQIGSAPVQPADNEKFYSLYKIRLIQGYGSTETALRVAGAPALGASEQEYLELVKTNTIGAELKWNNLEILTEAGKPAQENEEGEICIRGPILMQGYLKDEKATTDAFRGGWFHSGDVGYWRMINGQKLYCTNGRIKELIIKGGVNISPLAIEEAVIRAYPEVSFCFAVGYPDARFGEEIAVVVGFGETVHPADRNRVALEIKKAAAAGSIPHLAAYESPTHVVPVDFSTLPMTSTGKVQRVFIKTHVTRLLHPLAETKTHRFRVLTPFETKETVRALVRIHNTRWGKTLGITEETALRAITNGIVIGAFSKKTSALEGSVFAIRTSCSALDTPNNTMKTYTTASADLTLQSSDIHGDAFLLLSISTGGKPFIPPYTEKDSAYKALLAKAPQQIQSYLTLNTDPVLSFHQKPKAGMKEGATILHVLPRARPADVAAMGYNVIMKYPELPENVVVNAGASLGTQLIEAAFVFAKEQAIRMVYAYSRPAGFSAWLEKKLKQ